MKKLVPLSEAEEVLKIKLADLLCHPEITIHTEKKHGQIYVDPQEMMDASHAIKTRKERNGK